MMRASTRKLLHRLRLRRRPRTRPASGVLGAIDIQLPAANPATVPAQLLGWFVARGSADVLT
eukprot:8882328-Pyramimonas_sp.AAC.1